MNITFKGKSYDYMISGLAQLTNDVGRTCAMSLNAAHRISSLPLTVAEIKLRDTNKSKDVIKQINEKYGDSVTAEIADTSDSMLMMETSVGSITIFIYVISIIFMMVTIQMVCSKIFLKEKRDIGTLKSLGFTSKNLRIQFAFRFLVVSFLGTLLGTILCLLLNNQMMVLILRAIGVTNFKTILTFSVIGIPILSLCLCAFIFAYLASRKVKKVEVRQLIVE